MRLVFKGGAFCFGFNTEEGEVEILMIRGKQYAASVILSRENAASIRRLLVFQGEFYSEKYGI